MRQDNQARRARRAAKKVGLILIKSRVPSGYDIGDGYCLHNGYAPVYGS